MKPLLIVDGYNIIGAWELAAKKRWPLAECRDQLLHRLVEHAAYEGIEALLVFDGTHSDRLVRSQEGHGPVTVVYTRQGETADQYIERFVDGQPRHRDIRVATNDGVEQTVILGRGATRVPARELLRQVAQSHEQQRAQIARTAVKQHPLWGRLSKEQQEILERLRRGK